MGMPLVGGVFILELRRRGDAPISLGRVVAATCGPAASRATCVATVAVAAGSGLAAAWLLDHVGGGH